MRGCSRPTSVTGIEARPSGSSIRCLVLFLGLFGPGPARAAVPSETYTQPQQLVDVENGRRINLFCLGTGEPVVLLDAGFGSTIMAWRNVQDSIAKFSRTCSYDRAGYGFSDPATRASDARNAVQDLHALVVGGNLHKPLILVGHSEAGLYDLLYAATYPKDLAGLVLVDPHFAQFDRQLRRRQSATDTAKQQDATKGELALLERCVAQAKTGDLSKSSMQRSSCLAAGGSLDPVLTREWHRQAAGLAYEAANLSEAQSIAPKDPGGSSLDDDEVPAGLASMHDVPVRILLEDPDHPFPGTTPSVMATMMSLEWQDATTLAAQSSHGSASRVPHAGHDIQDDNPSAVMEAVMSIMKLPQRKH